MDDIVRSQFRIPGPLYEQLKAAAEQSGRSTNAEIVFRLGRSFSSDAGQHHGTETVAKSLAERLADKLAAPGNRGELVRLLATLQRLADEESTPRDSRD